MRKFFIAATLLLAYWVVGRAQELDVNIKINTPKLQTVDPKVFATLEKSIQEFFSTQKWTEDFFQAEERIRCNFILTIDKEESPTSFTAQLAVQSIRPVFGTTAHETTLLNFVDRNISFSYEQFQPILFSKNNFNDNLTSILAFYAYIILGLDYDSFSPLGGERFFLSAQEVMNTVPQGIAAAVKGWRPADGDRNRYWLVENLLSPKMRPFRQGMYDYHRQSLDLMSKDVSRGRVTMIQALEQVTKANQAYPNSMVLQLFNTAKADEIVEIFKGGSAAEKENVLRIMTRLDPSNVGKYRAIR